MAPRARSAGTVSGCSAIYFGSLLLGSFDERTMKKIYGNLRSMKPATAQLSPMSMD
jgi:hypothetical protein